jgi:hypothetical protein
MILKEKEKLKQRVQSEILMISFCQIKDDSLCQIKKCLKL